MRKIFLLGVLLASAFPLAATETVSTISFNPSRLGQYTYLKINKDINLKGGLQVSDQTHLNNPASDVGELVFTVANGGTVNIIGTKDLVFEIPNVTTKSNATSGLVSVNAPSALFLKASGATNTPVDSVEVYGGSMRMNHDTTNASSITTMTNASGTLLLQSNNNIAVGGNVVVTGGTGPSGKSGMTPLRRSSILRPSARMTFGPRLMAGKCASANTM